MELSSTLRRNEQKLGSCSLLQSIRIGDLVELLADGKFFQRTYGQPERYVGYVTCINTGIVGLSATHPSNRCHGYVCGRDEHPRQHTVEIETDHITHYRLLEYNKNFIMIT